MCSSSLAGSRPTEFCLACLACAPACAALCEGAEGVAGAKQGRLRNPPAPLSTVRRMVEAAEADAASDTSGLSSEEAEGDALLMQALAGGLGLP